MRKLIFLAVLAVAATIASSASAATPAGLAVASVKANHAVLPDHPFYVLVTVLDRAARPSKAAIIVSSADRQVLATQQATFRPGRRTTVIEE